MSKPNTRGATLASDKHPVDDSIEHLIDKVCTRFSNQLEAQINTKLDKINEKLDDVINRMDGLKKTVDSNRKSIDILEKKCNQFEQHSKRNSLIFYGINDLGEDVLNAVLSIINQTLKISCAPSDVDSVYWLGKTSNKTKSKSIRITFVSNITRTRVFGSKKLLKNSGISIYEDLTGDQYNLFQLAKKKYGHRGTWTAGGRVYVLKNNIKCSINSTEDL